MRLVQVFSNLLNNAAKFTPPGGAIALSARRQGGVVLISIVDNGVGIPPQMLSRIFDLFTQVNRSFYTNDTGLGIGLTIVKKLVEMHQGSIEARSVESGKGSEFLLQLPLSEGPAAISGVEGSAAQQLPVQRRVLIADDNVDSALSLGMMLELMGHNVRVVHNGLDALELADQFRPQAMLLDIGMPQLDGYEVARRVRLLPWGQSVQLVAVTGWGQAQDKHRAREAGFDAHLVKPADPEVLGALLRNGPQSA
jgi:CheY-like chemotaxis protein